MSFSTQMGLAIVNAFSTVESVRFRYILSVHTTCPGCPENADFTVVFETLRRGAENPSLSATPLRFCATKRRAIRKPLMLRLMVTFGALERVEYGCAQAGNVAVIARHQG
jgi:hypothetical protein